MPRFSEVELRCDVCGKIFKLGLPERPAPFCSGECRKRWHDARLALNQLKRRGNPCEICPFRKKTCGWLHGRAVELSLEAVKHKLPVTCARHAHSFRGQTSFNIRCAGIERVDVDPDFLTTTELAGINWAGEEASNYYWDVKVAVENGTEIPETTHFNSKAISAERTRSDI